jgi:hypothetical protein
VLWGGQTCYVTRTKLTASRICIAYLDLLIYLFSYSDFMECFFYQSKIYVDSTTMYDRTANSVSHNNFLSFSNVFAKIFRIRMNI